MIASLSLFPNSRNGLCIFWVRQIASATIFITRTSSSKGSLPNSCTLGLHGPSSPYYHHFLTPTSRESYWSDFLMAEVAKNYTFEEIKAEFTSRSRSVSPRKRQMTIPEEAQVTAKRVCLEEHAPHTVWGTILERALLYCQDFEIPILYCEFWCILQ
jgi:hypothetical protein